jgi:hypothetical protein
MEFGAVSIHDTCRYVSAAIDRLNRRAGSKNPLCLRQNRHQRNLRINPSRRVDAHNIEYTESEIARIHCSGLTPMGNALMPSSIGIGDVLAILLVSGYQDALSISVLPDLADQAIHPPLGRTPPGRTRRSADDSSTT